MTERHPRFHDFRDSKINDEVIMADPDGVPLVIKRHQWCAACPIERTVFIDVVDWRRYSHNYKNRPKVPPARVTREEYEREQFLATSDLPPALLAKIRKRR